MYLFCFAERKEMSDVGYVYVSVQTLEFGPASGGRDIGSYLIILIVIGISFRGLSLVSVCTAAI